MDTIRRGNIVRNILLVLAISVSCVGCDQLTKDIAKESLEPGIGRHYAGGLFLLQYEENQGGMLSLGADFSPRARFWLFTVGVGAILGLLFVFSCLSNDIMVADRVALAMIAGGGIGNLIDRLSYNGSVIDFMNVGVGGLRTAVFNVADVAVFFGALLLILRAMKRVAME